MPDATPASSQQPTPDPFDRLYLQWAAHAMEKRLDPPSRERWDVIVLRLILSKDPNRVARYKRLEAGGEESLGADALELWQKTPSYTPNLSVKVKDRAALHAYAQSQTGSMRRLMEGQGEGERYAQIVSEYEAYLAERKARAKSGQRSVLIMGCAGMGAILIMMLTVLLIIALQMAR